MKPWLTSAAAVLALGCTFSDGDPWGTAELRLAATFAPPPSRLEEGRLKTNHGLLVELDRVALGASSASLMGAGQSAFEFDPAAPPPGYSLCHNGHCHHESGALVPYEEIAAEGGGATVAVEQLVTAGIVELGEEPTVITLGPCLAGCDLDLGQIVGARVGLTRLELSGRVDGEAFDLQVPLSLSPRVALDEAVGRDSPLGLRVGLTVEVPPHLFDGVDPTAPDAAKGITANLDAKLVLVAVVDRD